MTAYTGRFLLIKAIEGFLEEGVFAGQSEG